MQALVIGLGANAKEADRGYGSMSNFIKQGADKAVIKVTLCNVPHKPYLEGWNTNDYGSRIVFQVTQNWKNTLAWGQWLKHNAHNFSKFFKLHVVFLERCQP